MAATNIQTPSARANDPASSHAAGSDVTRTGKRQTHIRQLAEIVAQNPGMTSAEIAFMVADKFPELTRHEVARRLADGKGTVVVQGDMRKCKACRRACVTWWPTQSALQAYGSADSYAAIGRLN